MPAFTRVGVVGTGAMGAGIAQIAAQAGATVLLFDAKPDAAEAARVRLGETWAKLVERGKLPAHGSASSPQSRSPISRRANSSWRRSSRIST
jgi:3-hydroxybutyryl-CoA dehydrogenase